ncbi:unnamed protein product [Lampetra fluviatilis]
MYALLSMRPRPGGSTQERAATSGSARLIFSSTGRVDSGASCDQRVGSTHLQLDREGRLRSELRPAGQLDSSSARPGGSTQERAATSGSARLIFSLTGRVDSGASCDQRVGSIHLQLDREGRLRSELRPAGRLDSSSARPGGSTQERAATSGSARLIFSSTGRVDSGARPGGSTQERAATSGSARLIFSLTGRVDSGASCDQRVGSTHLQLDREGRLRSELRPAGRLDSSARLGLSRVRSAHRSRLSGLDSSGSPSPLQAGKTRLTAQLGLRGSTSAESEVSAAAGVVRIAVWRRGFVLTLGRRPNTARCERAVGATYRPGSELRQRINGHPPVHHGDRGATDTYDAHRPLTTRPPGVCLT